MTDATSRSLAARARAASNDPAMSLRLRGLLNECADRLDAMQQTARSRNRTIRRMRWTIDRILGRHANERKP